MGFAEIVSGKEGKLNIQDGGDMDDWMDGLLDDWV